MPVERLLKEFGTGLTPEDVCAATIRSLRAAGVKHIYMSNLPVHRARQTLANILARV